MEAPGTCPVCPVLNPALGAGYLIEETRRWLPVIRPRVAWGTTAPLREKGISDMIGSR